MVRWGRAFNAVAEPTGRSFTNWIFLPVRLSASLLGLALAEHAEDTLPLRERQALEHWKRYVEENPSSPEAVAILDRIEEAQLRWLQTQHEHGMRRARAALERNDPKLAALMATRSLRYRPEDDEAIRMVEEASKLAGELEIRAAESVAVSADASTIAPGQRELLVALLRSPRRRAQARRGICSMPSPRPPSPTRPCSPSPSPSRKRRKARTSVGNTFAKSSTRRGTWRVTPSP